ncbi:hypothetical protein LCGC14_2524840, partial [marine sediment metagenome]
MPASSNSSKEVFGKIINQFQDDDDSFSSGELSIVGTPFGSLNPSAAGAVGDIIDLVSNVNGTSATTFLSGANWVESTEKAGTYYWNVNPTSDPSGGLAWHGDLLQKTTLPSDIFGIGQWSYGDIDSLGFDTIYIRTPLDTDPFTLPSTQDRYAILRIDEGSKGKDISAEDTFAQDVVFSVDGSIMFVLGESTRNIFQYTLSTPFDVATAVYASKSFDPSSQTGATMRGVAFSSDGTKMYVLSNTNDTVYQYTLSTAWDVSTAAYASKSKDVSSEDGGPEGVTFKTDGTKMFICGSANDTIFRYTLSTPWDVSTASVDANIKDVSAEDTSPLGVTFKPDGLIMYIVGIQNNTVFQYTLGAAWDLSTASFASKSKDVSGEEGNPTGVDFSSDGTKMYIVGNDEDTVFQYILSTPWDVSTASFTAGSPTNLFRKQDEGKYIQINSGLVLITTFIDNTQVRG